MININTVQTLIGKNQLQFFLNCVASLLDKSNQNISVHFHSDGSLTTKEEDFIFSRFPKTEISISNPSESKSNTLDALFGRPNCQKFRKESIWGLEFFDPLFAYPDDNISFYIDADILFIRPFSGLFDRDKVQNGAVFLKDTQWDSYCFRPWQLIGRGEKPKIVKGITTGLVFWDKTAIDWDYIEWFLAACHLHYIPEWIVPTAQAGLAHRCEAKTISPTQITNLYPNAQIHEDTFGVHLLGSYREEWMQKLQMKENNQKENLTYMTPSFEECVSQNIFGYSLRQIRRWKNTRLNIW